jgi:hypothetical protein
MNEELTQEQKQAIWSAGWLADRGYSLLRPLNEAWTHDALLGKSQTFSDAELIAYAKEKGMELPPELVGWTPIDHIPDEWKDGRPLLNCAYDLMETIPSEAIRIGYYYESYREGYVETEKGSGLYRKEKTLAYRGWNHGGNPTHAMPLPTPPKDGVKS